MEPINLEVHWEEKWWTFNIQSLDIEEAMVIKAYAGTNPLRLIGYLMRDPGELSPKDFQCILWLMKRRGGVMYPVEQTPRFDVLEFMDAIMVAVNKFQDDAVTARTKEDAERAEKGLPPKKPPSRTRARGSTSKTN